MWSLKCFTSPPCNLYPAENRSYGFAVWNVESVWMAVTMPTNQPKRRSQKSCDLFWKTHNVCCPFSSRRIRKWDTVNEEKMSVMFFCNSVFNPKSLGGDPFCYQSQPWESPSPGWSVEEAAAAPGPTVAVQFVALILNGELVVISQLFAAINLAQSKDDNVLLAFHIDDARVAVGFAGVVDKTGRVAVHGGVDHLKVIYAEHVAANPLRAQEQRKHNVTLD